MAEQTDVQAARTEERERMLLTVPQAAELAKRHQNTIRNWIYRGLLPAQKVGKYGRFKIRWSDLDATLRYEPTFEAEAAGGNAGNPQRRAGN